MPRRGVRWLAILAALIVTACSGARGSGGNDAPPTAAEAARFLTQATYGPTDSTISQVRASGYSQWIDQQMVAPAPRSHLGDVDATLAELRLSNPGATLNPPDFYASYWRQSITGQDQLRQRMKLAYSEIFVISLVDSNIDVRGAASFYDMLGQNAFGNFRTLLEQVALHPMMGIYLTWLGNQKEDPATGRNPDENFAREVMQLMTIGLFQLNPDGTVRTDPSGRPLATYTADDISGLAKVFTGYSYFAPVPTASTFRGGNRFNNDATIRPMIAYAQFHSTSAKSFLGVNIPESSTPDPAGDLKIALDTLFNHPNVGPFIGKQLIQRLVTSNPSPAYVGRVAAVFNNNGKGVRGDMAAVVRAILLDPEARSLNAAAPGAGKLREPVVRLANWARAFNATSASGDWAIVSTSANTSLSQSALTSPSVFNFFRPGYSPPNSRVGNAGLVAPEFQIVDEVTVAGYLNTMQGAIDNGIGTNRDVRSAYAAETPLAADDVNALVDRVDLLLTNGAMSSGLRSRIVGAVGSVSVHATPGTGRTDALLNRAKLAVFMTMASPEYLVQR